MGVADSIRDFYSGYESEVKIFCTGGVQWVSRFPTAIGKTTVKNRRTPGCTLKKWVASFPDNPFQNKLEYLFHKQFGYLVFRFKSLQLFVDFGKILASP